MTIKTPTWVTWVTQMVMGYPLSQDMIQGSRYGRYRCGYEGAHECAVGIICMMIMSTLTRVACAYLCHLLALGNMISL